MKNYKHIFSLLLLALVACDKAPENIQTSFTMQQEAEPSATQILLSGTFETKATISAVSVFVSEDKSMKNNVQQHFLMLDKQEFAGTIANLRPNTTYYYQYHFNAAGSTKLSDLYEATTTDGKVTFDISTISAVTNTSAQISCNILSDGGAEITSRGVCYSKTINPTADGKKVLCGKGKGDFWTTLKDLDINTTYYVCPFATNSTDTYYGEIVYFKTGQPMVTFGSFYVSNITAHSAMVNGSITSDGGFTVTEHGVCYSTVLDEPVENYTKVVDPNGGSRFMVEITGLQQQTKYYVAVYATNAGGTFYSGKQEFTTENDVVKFEAETNIADVTANSAKVLYQILSNGGNTITEHGVYYAAGHEPTNSDKKVSSTEKSGVWDIAYLTNLATDRTYYVLPYAVNSTGTYYYGTVATFTTKSGDVTFGSTTISEITNSTANLICRITDTGGLAITERGACYSTRTVPTTADTKVSSGTGAGAYEVSLTELSGNTTYYVRPYAINSNGTYYGTQVSFTTNAPPTFSNLVISNIQSNSASVSCTIVEGAEAIIERGVCYSSTTSTPTALGNKAIGNGNDFVVNLMGLTANTLYYVCAYAKTSTITHYSTVTTFTTTTATTPTTPSPTGAISGTFAVSATQKVYFSKGNLQYQASTNTWRFAEHQYDYVGTANNNISTTYSEWIDLFGWGTGANPTLHTQTADDYSTFVDWGTNAILNGGNVANAWRTLSVIEWDYLISHTKSGLGKVGETYGIILLPENWTLPSGCSFTQNFSTSNGNVYTTAQWELMENAGAVFLPAAGIRGATTNNVNSHCCFWTSSTYQYNTAEKWGYRLRVTYDDWMSGAYDPWLGLSVRLVQNLP